MSALSIHPFEPDALSDADESEARLDHLLSEMERNRRYAIEQMRDEARHWRQRFEHYESFCQKLLEEPESKANFNSLGELQGNVEQFDLIAIRVKILEDSIAGIRKILYPGESRAIRSSGKTNKSTTGKRRKAAGRNQQ